MTNELNAYREHLKRHSPRDDLLVELNDLERVCRRLLAAYKTEEAEHGFPFSFELRAAHRDLAAHFPESGRTGVAQR